MHTLILGWVNSDKILHVHVHVCVLRGHIAM